MAQLKPKKQAQTESQHLQAIPLMPLVSLSGGIHSLPFNIYIIRLAAIVKFSPSVLSDFSRQHASLGASCFP